MNSNDLSDIKKKTITLDTTKTTKKKGIIRFVNMDAFGQYFVISIALLQFEHCLKRFRNVLPQSLCVRVRASKRRDLFSFGAAASEQDTILLSGAMEVSPKVSDCPKPICNKLSVNIVHRLELTTKHGGRCFMSFSDSFAHWLVWCRYQREFDMG